MYGDADFQQICIWESSLKSASLMRKNYIFMVKDVALWIQIGSMILAFENFSWSFTSIQVTFKGVKD